MCSLERVVPTAVNALIAGTVAGRRCFVAPAFDRDSIESRQPLRHARFVDADPARETKRTRSREDAGEPRLVGEIGPI